jgi:hypothetical protein
MATSEDKPREDFEPMDVQDVGHVGEVLKGGGGKLTVHDPRKPKGQE